MTAFVSENELEYQRECMRRVRAMQSGATAFVDTYGCQQNEADSERMRGMLREMGYTLAPDERADLVIINTCAVREHAEQRALGNIGHMVHYKRENPAQKIILAGCMAGEPGARERVRRSYRQVDAVLDTTNFWRLPETVLHLLETGERSIPDTEPDSRIAEGLPVVRTHPHKAYVSIMYGCNNFCTYCIVPHVRGRERSRCPQDVLGEVEALVKDGCRDIMLLGQNVNSYAGEGMDFAELLGAAASFDGDYVVRFMTSHPKDCTHKLIDTIASCPKVERHIHLPVQSGSSRILKAMNRRYTRESYLELVDYARSKIPGLVLTSDVIVGFPGATEQDFEDTLSLVREERYDSLFTFIFSPREGTPAAAMDDPTTREEKSERFARLTDLQNEISMEIHSEAVGRTVRALIDGESRGGELNLAARTQEGRLINLAGDPSLTGQFRDVEITGATTWSFIGRLK